MPTTATTSPLELAQVDPTNLTVRDQAREDATPDDDLIASIRAHGIIQPPVVEINGDGEWVIVTGHRRVGAAIAAGLGEITVIVRPLLAGDAAAITLEQQIVENERRKQLTAKDLAAGYQKLSLFGLRPEDIAAGLGEKPERVAAGIRAAASGKTTALLESRPTLDLEKAAVLSEFDEHPALQRELAETALDKPQDFEWRVRSAQEKIAKESKTAELKAEIRASGVKLAKTDGYGGLKVGTTRLSDLVDAKGKKLTPKNHAGCDGHRAFIDGWRIDELKIDYACEDYKTHGHDFPGSAPREISEEEKAAEAERQEREAAVAANRAARRQWIGDLLPGKINQLAGVYEYMAAALVQRDTGYGDHRSPRHTLSLLGIEVEDTSYKADSRALNELADSKRVAPFRLMFATALGVHEDKLERGNDATSIVRHLEQIERWGYALSELDTSVLEHHRGTLARQAEAVDVDQDEDGEGDE